MTPTHLPPPRPPPAHKIADCKGGVASGANVQIGC